MTDELATTDAGARRLTVYYIAALSAVAFLTIVGQLLVQSQLQSQLNDSKVVNLAGRQRMLSQRLCKCAVLLQSNAEPAARAGYLEELRALLPIWRRTQLGLQHGDLELGLPANRSARAAETFTRLEPAFATIYASGERLAAADSLGTGSAANLADDARRDLAAILAGEAAYLQGMDEIVSQFEAESHERVARLQRLERILLFSTLTVLLLEGFLVFRPAAMQIAASIFALQHAGKELRTAKNAAESANSVKTKFLANMSHELRTPLHAVLGAAELLRSANPALARADYLDVVDDSGRMLLCLLNDVLDLAKIEADKIDLHPTSIDLREFVRRTLSMFRVAAQAKHLELQDRIEADVPRVVVADSLRLRQVLANLLSNAIKFTDHGTVGLEISASAPAAGRTTVRIAVVDTGIGIPQSDQARVFESFTQLEAPVGSSTNSAPAGAGLGLAISARLVALMGGRLELQSELGKGSTFAFSISCPTPTEQGEHAGGSTTGGAARGAPLRILAADDSPVGLRVLEEFLRADGHRVQSAVDGGSAIEAFQHERFDLVLLDLRMPGTDGAAAVAAMRDFERRQSIERTPIVALTAEPLESSRNLVRPGDFDDFVTKPFSGVTLQRAIRRQVPNLGTTTATEVDLVRADHQASDRSAGHGDKLARILSRLQGKQSLLAELIDLFLEGAPVLLATIRRTAGEGNDSELHTAVHCLRGQLETFEAGDGSVIALRIEQACGSADATEIHREISALEQCYPTIVAELTSLKSQLSIAVVA